MANLFCAGCGMLSAFNLIGHTKSMKETALYSRQNWLFWFGYGRSEFNLPKDLIKSIDKFPKYVRNFNDLNNIRALCPTCSKGHQITAMISI